MEEELEFIHDTAKEHMETTISHFVKALSKIRAGRANPSMLGSIQVEYYGNHVPLTQVSNVNTPDARTITIQPWEKNMIGPIETEIRNANLGFNPTNNGDIVIIAVPPLTEERRKDLVKMARAEAEDSRIGIRTARKTANDELKALDQSHISEDVIKDHEKDIQELTNTYIKRIDDMLEKKEADIMTV
jgi:ribosome recycling factor